MNICVQVFVSMYVFFSLGYIPSGERAGSYGDSMFNLLRSCHTASRSDCTIVHSIWCEVVTFMAFCLKLHWFPD